MSLAQRIYKANRPARLRQHRAELRVEEISRVAHIATDYESIDRRGDLAMETRFQQLYQLADDEPEREAVVAAFVTWQKAEQAEESTVRTSVDDSVDLLKENNPVFIDGPEYKRDGCGPDGRAA